MFQVLVWIFLPQEAFLTLRWDHSTTHSYSISYVFFYFDGCGPVTSSCLSLREPTNCSTSGFPVLHYLPEFAQAQVHWVGDSIQPSHLCHPLLFLPSIFPSFRVLYNESTLRVRWPKYGTSALTLPMNIQGWFFLGLTGLISLLSKELSIVFSRTVWKYQLFGPQSSLLSNAQNTLRMPLRLRIPGIKSCTTQFHGWPNAPITSVFFAFAVLQLGPTAHHHLHLYNPGLCCHYLSLEFSK